MNPSSYMAANVLLVLGCLLSAAAEYSTNAICAQNNCINPVFPGLEDLSLLESIQWQCQPVASARNFMKFCGGAVHYDVAIPSPNQTATLKAAVTAQDNAAATMFVYHLAGMNMEAWDYQNPGEATDPCVRSVWKMVCNTYFPRSESGCNANEATPYMRPCQNVCEHYVNACNVQCCDESSKCVFSQQVSLIDGTSSLRSGYVAQVGPSATCTGGAARGASQSFLASASAFFVSVLVFQQ